MVNVNRYRRGLTKSQCGAVAARLEPHISPGVEKRRIEKIKAAWAQKREGGCLPNLANNLNADPGGVVSARAIAAQIMGVSDRYVGDAMRVQRESPELFEKIWNGQITVNAAIRLLDGVTETESARQTRTLRRELNILFRDPDPRFLERLEQVVAEFRDAG